MNVRHTHKHAKRRSAHTIGNSAPSTYAHAKRFRKPVQCQQRFDGVLFDVMFHKAHLGLNGANGRHLRLVHFEWHLGRDARVE